MIAALLAAAAMAAPGISGQSVPLYAIDTPCNDPRYPALAGPWVVGCGPSGEVDRALSLKSGRLVKLPRALTSPGLGEGAIYAPGLDGWLYRLDEDGAHAVEGIARVTAPPLAPPATDGIHVAILTDRGVEAFAATEHHHRVFPTRPWGWYPPALAWPDVAWVTDGGPDAEDIWWIDAVNGRHPQPLAAGPGHQRHVVGSEHWLAWVEDDAVVVLDITSGARHRYRANTGFSAAPSLWRDVACWEERPPLTPTDEAPRGPSGLEAPTDGIDIRCSDGVTVGGPGDQHKPSRWADWLLYRDGKRVMLYTLPDEPIPSATAASSAP